MKKSLVILGIAGVTVSGSGALMFLTVSASAAKFPIAGVGGASGSQLQDATNYGTEL